MKSLTTILTLSIATSAALMAAGPVIPTTGDILRQAQQPKLPEEAKALPSVGAKEYKAPLSAKDDMKTFVKSFKFSGNSVFTSEELALLVKPYEGKELGINGLKEVASIITKYYRDHGYFVARAYIPAQSLEGGVVEIAIIEGTYGGFDVKNTSLVDDNEVQGFMDYLKQGQIVSTMSLERQMLLINDLSGATVTGAEVYPGKEVGTSDFGITTAPTNKYSGYGIMDNYGSVYTGEYRLSAGAYINSLSGIGDTLTLSGMISNTANLKNGAFAYSRPLGYTGLKGSINASTTRYKLDHINNYDAFGTANNVGAGVSYPLIKTRSHTQSIALDYNHRAMKDSSGIPGSVDEAQKSTDAATLSFTDKSNTDILNHPGKLYASISMTTGKAHMDNAIATTHDALIDTAGNYTKANLNVTHTQQFNPTLSLQSTIKAQKSFGKNLDSSEDLSVGGSNGVRAYEDSELSGDQGYVLSFDLIQALPKIDQINHYASVFIDTAKVWKNTTVFNTEDNTRNLNAVGVGYTLNYQAFDLKATYAHGFGGESTPTTEAEFSTSKNKFLIQGMMRF